MQQALLMATAIPGTPGYESGMDGGYFDGMPRGSFRVGRDRRSWLFSPGFSPAVTVDQASGQELVQQDRHQKERRKCC
ncbi:hypothetical protein G7Z17_g13545 [Cylindrodendrum hubeiense]|uniref:Uncharacterized protein n=1 Tax=Cylindrodendrum hubeiense TaxID=595255 RepID=A0A9P5GTD9_9HYPO|nr:hypothetical protein G7Z17_g13545 [Cylindrodendrum hubeiense]